MLPPLTTPRLTLRPISLDDAPGIFKAYSDSEAMRFLPYLPHKTIVDTRRDIQREIDMGSCYWSIRLIGTEEAIGKVGFLGNTRVPAMGYIIQRAHWGKGIMTEAMRSAITHAFNEQRHDRVELWIDERNIASRRVAEKLGFNITGRIHGRFQWEEKVHISYTYGLYAAQWAEAINPVPARVPLIYSLQPVLPTHNMEATITFYRERLGFDVDFIYGNPPRHCAVSRGDWSAEGATIQFTAVPRSTEIQPQGWLYFHVHPEIDELYQSFAAQGVSIDQEPDTYPWGMREFQIKDNNGHVLRFGTQDFR